MRLVSKYRIGTAFTSHLCSIFFEMQSMTHTLIEAGANAAAAPMRERQIVADFILFLCKNEVG